MAHISGCSREQLALFPRSLDDAVSGDHPVRVIDAFVESRNLRAMGFSNVVSEERGRPSYNPADLLKLQIYGYSYRFRASRALEKECERNVEVMWLIGGLTPSFKTIADFRRDNAKAIIETCREFVLFCRDQSLLGGEVMAIDGSKIEAVASRKQVVTKESLERTIASLDRKIAAHLAAMEEADRQEEASPEAELDRARVAQALQNLKAMRANAKEQAEELVAVGRTQLVLTEPEARLMRTADNTYDVAYNAQIAADAKHQLIIAFDLVNEANDERQLYPMALKGKQALGVEKVTAIADAGYSNGKQAQECEKAGITPIAPRSQIGNSEGAELYTRDAFTYDEKDDTYRCPAGDTLTCREVSHSEEKKKYWGADCANCPLKRRCTTAEKRMIVRSFYEAPREAMNQRAKKEPRWMAQRRQVVEHPFGTIKWLMGNARFLLRGLLKAKAELALTVLAYNIKRAINTRGVEAIIRALQPA